MSWIMHSSGPWKDHKYKSRSGSPGNYVYDYGKGNRDRESAKETRDHSRTAYNNMLEDNAKSKNSKWGRNEMLEVKDKYDESQKQILNSYKNDRTGYQSKNSSRVIGGEEAEKGRTKRNARAADRRKQFETLTLSAMRRALNTAKENKHKKTDADMRDAAVARGREQYMTNRAAKAANNIASAVQRNREEKKRAEYERDKILRKSGFRR